MRHTLTAALPAALAALLLTSGCTPTCQQTCDKLTSCEQLDDWAGGYTDLCAQNCEREHNLYELWGDTQLTDALDAAQTCIGDATCDDIADGVCYDDSLYVF